MSQIVGLGNSYKLWENGNLRKLAQSLNQALTSKVKDDWEEILGDINDWKDVDKDQCIRMLQKLEAKTFGPKAY